MSRRGRRPPGAGKRRHLLYALGGALLVSVLAGAFFLSAQPGGSATQSKTGPSTVIMVSSTATSSSLAELSILYVDQGNGAVNESNFAPMLSFASSHGFDTVFFQVYREGVLLFTPDALRSFVTTAHAQSLKVYFALYFTDPSQQLPATIYGLGEDGISLDMSTLSPEAQADIFGTLQQGYKQGLTAITTTDPNNPLRPDVLVLETYTAQDQAYIRHGVVASVGVFATSSRQQYEQQVQYALQNSDGVMVFDYAGLMKSGY